MVYVTKRVIHLLVAILFLAPPALHGSAFYVCLRMKSPPRASCCCVPEHGQMGGDCCVVISVRSDDAVRATIGGPDAPRSSDVVFLPASEAPGSPHVFLSPLPVSRSPGARSSPDSLFLLHSAFLC